MEDAVPARGVEEAVPACEVGDVVGTCEGPGEADVWVPIVE